jgi:hypothetical protein
MLTDAEDWMTRLCRLLGYMMMINRNVGCVAVLCQSLHRYGTQWFRDKLDSNMNSVFSLCFIPARNLATLKGRTIRLTTKRTLQNLNHKT